MKHYIEEQKRQLREIMERPVTLGRAEEVTVYADAICALHKLDDDHFRESTKMMEFTREDAEKWVSHMGNEDGTTGARWTMEQTDAVANVAGVHEKSCVWWAAMNMMYSDYYPVAVEFGLNRPEFYAALAKAFLLDKDGPGPEQKLMAYYEHIAK